MVIATELPENEATSTTNIVEELAADVLTSYLSDRAGHARPFLWVEHYPPHPGGRGETFDLVTFKHYRPWEALRAGRWQMVIGAPAWRRARMSSERL